MKIIKILFFVLLAGYVNSQTYQTLFSNFPGVYIFKDHKFNFDSRKHILFQPFGVSGAPCITDSLGFNAYKINPRSLAIYKPFNDFFQGILCQDIIFETCWPEPVDIICISNSDSNFIISYLQTNMTGGPGNCTSIIWYSSISYDGGITKTGILSGLKIKAMEINPVDDNIIYATSENNIYKSTNRGVSFNITANVNDLTNVLRVSPINPSLIFVSTSSGMFISTNAGVSFSSLGISSFKDMYFDMTQPIVHGAGNGVYKSTDNGLNWIQISSLNSTCVEVNPDYDSVIYIGTNTGVYRSLNGGQTFNHSEINFPISNQILGLSKDLNSGDSIIVCTNYGIYKVWDLLTGAEETITGILPQSFELKQNYPNPFNPSTVIGYFLTGNHYVVLRVYDARGNEVATLINEKQGEGNYEVQFDGSNFPSGLYFYKISVEGYTDTKRMILLK